MRALTEQVYVDAVENDEEGIAEMLMDDNVIASVSRPGTSLNVPRTAQGQSSQAFRYVKNKFSSSNCQHIYTECNKKFSQLMVAFLLNFLR